MQILGLFRSKRLSLCQKYSIKYGFFFFTFAAAYQCQLEKKSTKYFPCPISFFQNLIALNYKQTGLK